MSLGGWILVGVLGGAAACARYLLDAEISRLGKGTFPVGVLVVNLSGSFALGLVAGSTLEGQALVIISGGVIGSFTTFSTWILDSHLLADSGQLRLAWLNVCLSAVVGFAAVALGQAISG